MAVKEKVLQFANQVSRNKPGSRGWFGENDARYRILSQWLQMKWQKFYYV